jgi:uncharacterized protein YciI
MNASSPSPTMSFILQAFDRPGTLDLRRRVRVPHLEFVASRASVFRFGGPMLGEDGTALGSLMIMDLPDRLALNAYIAADPFFACGLFASVHVWETRQVVPECTSGALQTELERQRREALQAP